MLDRAVLGSALHLRWMAGSELQRGLFTPLRVDPARLTPSERRFLSEALLRGHAGAGVQALGGPGACPGAKAPPSTQLFCVDGDVWEMPALQWMHLGVVAELVPSARAVHHFVAQADPAAPRFSDPQQRPLLLRARQYRSNGAPLAGHITGTSFAGTGPSAIAWLADEADPLAPPRTFHHLELASTLPDPRARDHHLAMAMVGLGALLHVLQDMSVPAHARGDVSAFFSALSDAAGDRGLPFSELARLAYRRHDLPGQPGEDAVARARGGALAQGLRAHFLGDAGYEGLAVFTGRRFLSERTVPAAQHVDPGLAPERAAAQLLAGAALDPSEVEGAVLSPWPAARGYLRTATGRPLAAFDTDAEGRVRTYVDEAVYREQFAQLVPRAVEATRSLIDWMWPSWPELRYDAAAGFVDLDVAADLAGPELLVLTQTAEGLRTIRQKVRLRPGVRNRVQGLPKLAEDQRSVIVLRARRPTGEPLVLEHVLGAESKVFAPVPGPVPVVAPAPAPERGPEGPGSDAPSTPAEPQPVAVDPSAPPPPEASPAALPTEIPPAPPLPTESPDGQPKGPPGPLPPDAAAKPAPSLPPGK
jgi:hypothetical protein